jgi:hypothetical protein
MPTESPQSLFGHYFAIAAEADARLVTPNVSDAGTWTFVGLSTMVALPRASVTGPPPSPGTIGPLRAAVVAVGQFGRVSDPVVSTPFYIVTGPPSGSINVSATIVTPTGLGLAAAIVNVTWSLTTTDAPFASTLRCAWTTGYNQLTQTVIGGTAPTTQTLLSSGNDTLAAAAGTSLLPFSRSFLGTVSTPLAQFADGSIVRVVVTCTDDAGRSLSSQADPLPAFDRTPPLTTPGLLTLLTTPSDRAGALPALPDLAKPVAPQRAVARLCNGTTTPVLVIGLPDNATDLVLSWVGVFRDPDVGMGAFEATVWMGGTPLATLACGGTCTSVAFNATAAMEAYRGASSDDGLACVLAPLTFSVSGTNTQGLGVTVNSTALYVLDATAPVVAPGTQCSGTAVQVCDPGSATPVTCTPLSVLPSDAGVLTVALNATRCFADPESGVVQIEQQVVAVVPGRASESLVSAAFGSFAVHSIGSALASVTPQLVVGTRYWVQFRACNPFLACTPYIRSSTSVVVADDPGITRVVSTFSASTRTLVVSWVTTAGRQVVPDRRYTVTVGVPGCGSGASPGPPCLASFVDGIVNGTTNLDGTLSLSVPLALTAAQVAGAKNVFVLATVRAVSIHGWPLVGVSPLVPIDTEAPLVSSVVVGNAAGQALTTCIGCADAGVLRLFWSVWDAPGTLSDPCPPSAAPLTTIATRANDTRSTTCLA